MKIKIYFCISSFLLVIALFIWNCTDTELIRSSPLMTNMNFSIEEARIFFEKSSQHITTRTNEEQFKYNISPGEFVPKWNNAIGFNKKQLSRYDIPIEAGVRYKAMYAENKKGKSSMQVVNVYQGLVIVKDIKTNNICQYVLTVIPSKEYDNKFTHNVYNRFVSDENKGEFTGIAIYTIPQRNLIARANRYLGGNKVQGVFMLDTSEALESRFLTLKSIIKDIVFNRNSIISTRSEGEDDWDFGSDEQNYINICDGLFYDKVHDVFLYDSDGDGKPDSVWIPEVDITPEHPDNIDPDPTPNPLPDISTPNGECPFCGMIDCNGECLHSGGELNPDTDLIRVPCGDEISGKSTPLPLMYLAPPSSFNVKGATFGKTRNNGTKMHYGVDLAGEVGDFVYAAHAGTISRIVSNQVNRINGKYPANYTGDRNAAGNRIYITVSTGVEDAYFHLRAGEPIAINPSTGTVFKVGDVIEMGDIIGYIGITGNANPNVSHLHFGVRVNGKWEDPFNYINATLKDNGNNKLSISTPCDE